MKGKLRKSASFFCWVEFRAYWSKSGSVLKVAYWPLSARGGGLLDLYGLLDHRLLCSNSGGRAQLLAAIIIEKRIGSKGSSLPTLHKSGSAVKSVELARKALFLSYTKPQLYLR